MSILISSTIEQDEKIKSLCSYLLKQVFPRYISEELVELFEAEQLFHIDEQTLQYVQSLQDASQVINALNTIISILETPALLAHYDELFTESVHMLQSYQITFPFPLFFFREQKQMKRASR